MYALTINKKNDNIYIINYDLKINKMWRKYKYAFDE